MSTLESRVAGDVLMPGAPEYESARTPAVPRVDHPRPRAIVRCHSEQDIAAALAFAEETGTPVAVRSGGHCFAGRSSTDGILIDVTPMSTVAVADGVATIGAGTRLADLYDALDAHGLTIPAGCGPTVGISGLMLGGGIGVLGRTYGLTCDRLVGARVVLADGRAVDCDAHRHADLFWALRGAGGGQFGVVTSLAFDPVPASAATAFHVVWPADAAADLVAAWTVWAPDAPDALDATLRLAAAGEPGSAIVPNLVGLCLGAESDIADLLRALVAGGGREPASASYRHLPFRAAKEALVGLGSVEDGDADAGGLGLPFNRSEFFRGPLPADTVAALVQGLGAGRRLGEERQLTFMPWGGAYNRVAADATAFAHRNERYLLDHVVVAGDPGAFAAGQRWVRRSWSIAHRWGSGRVYPNFPDPDLADWAAAYHANNQDRLRRVKQAYDPDGVFRRDEQSL
jgi:FAD/FMN-containing dehydrogenase